jgi:hypothetical protein
LQFGLKTGGDGFFSFGLKTGGDCFSRFDLKISCDGFPDLSLKTGSYDLVIWVSKSLRWFLGLSLKIKRTTVYRLRHKTDGRMKMAWDTRQDLAAYFTYKQVRLGFFSLPQNRWRRDGRWCMWHHSGDCIEFKSKTDESMRRAVLNPSTSPLPFLLY